jgi:hypothetical protein
MNRRNPVATVQASVALALFLLAAAQSRSEVLIYDGFGSTEFGWGSGDWTLNPTASVDFSDYDDNFGTLGRAEFSIPSVPFTGNPYGIDRQFGTAPQSGATFYFSYVFQMMGEVDTNDLFDSGIAPAADLGYTSPGNGEGRILSAGIDVDSTGGADSDHAGVRLASFGQGNTLNAGTYLVIARFSSTDADAAYEDAKMWAITSANYDAIKADGITETELDGNNAASASVVGDNPNATFLSSYYHGIVARRMTGWYDEIKYTSELRDIFTAPIPEPSSLMLVILCLPALACRRRSR